MPSEDRRIIFNYIEVYKALYNLSLKKAELPQMIVGLIVKVEVNGNDQSILNAYIKNPETGTKKIVTYSKDFMAAALMAYCRGLGIPLPRRASKNIMIDKDNVVLRILVG